MTTTEIQNNHAILQAAGALFAETGYGQTDVETIAEKAEVDPAFIYSEFCDKAGLCHAWLVSLHQHSEARHADILRSETDPVDKVSDYFEHHLKSMHQKLEAGQLKTEKLNKNTMKNQNHSTHLRSFIKGSLLIAAAALSIGSLQAKDYQLADHEIRWTGSMPAKTHEGQLTLKSIEADISETGTVTLLKAVVDMSAINVTDLEGKKRDKLTGHLESDDFFHVEEYPTATFVLDEHKEDTFHGTLTIRGTSKKVALPAKVSGHPDRGWMLVGDFDYNRNDFGVDYQNSGLLGFMNAAKSKLIDDRIDVSVSVTLEPTT